MQLDRFFAIAVTLLLCHCLQLISLIDDVDVVARAIALRCVHALLSSSGDISRRLASMDGHAASIGTLLDECSNLMNPQVSSTLTVIRCMAATNLLLFFIVTVMLCACAGSRGHPLSFPPHCSLRCHAGCQIKLLCFLILASRYINHSVLKKTLRIKHLLLRFCKVLLSVAPYPFQNGTRHAGRRLYFLEEVLLPNELRALH